MMRYCPNCDADVEVRQQNKIEKYRVRGEEVEVPVAVSLCTICGETVSDYREDARVILAAYDAYRERHGLLKAGEIKAIRERYGLSQRALARLLGWGVVTIQRYENGALQDPTHDKELRRLEDPLYVLELIDQSGARLSTREKESLKAAVLGMAKEESRRRIYKDIEAHFVLKARSNPAAHGFQEFSLERAGALVSWLSWRCAELFKTKLAKLLWLTDFAYYRLHRISITGLAYARAPHGPIPDGLNDLLAGLEATGEISLTLEEAGDLVGEVIEAEGPVDLDVFSPSERCVLEWVAARFGNWTSKALSDASHREAVWAERNNGDLIPYDEANRVEMLSGVEECLRAS